MLSVCIPIFCELDECCAVVVAPDGRFGVRHATQCAYRSTLLPVLRCSSKYMRHAVTGRGKLGSSVAVVVVAPFSFRQGLPCTLRAAEKPNKEGGLNYRVTVTVKDCAGGVKKRARFKFTPRCTQLRGSERPRGNRHPKPARLAVFFGLHHWGVGFPGAHKHRRN